MSAFGPKLTCVSALHMSAFGGKADMTVCRCPLSRSLSGVKRTSLFAPHMSAFDPKRTSGDQAGKRWGLDARHRRIDAAASLKALGTKKFPLQPDLAAARFQNAGATRSSSWTPTR